MGGGQVEPGSFPARTFPPSFLLASYFFPSVIHVKVAPFQGKGNRAA